MDTIKKQRNIILIYIHTFLSTFILYYICDTLFYIERGLTSSQYISFLITILLRFISISFVYIIIGVMIILFGIVNLIARRKI